MAWIANIVYCVAALAYLPVLGYAMVVQKKNRHGWREKCFGPRPFAALPAGNRRIWIHAVSLGEVNATRSLVAGLQQAVPDVEVVVSTTTDTGYARARTLYGADRVFRYPLDFSWAVNRALTRVAPAMIVLIELEVWYNLVRAAQRRGVPVCVVNGRLTERSARRFSWIQPLARGMFSRLRWVAAQDEPIALRFVAVGTPKDRVTVCGSMKWDTAEVTDGVPGADAMAAALGIDRARPLWVAGSTGPGEEEIILAAHQRLLDGHPDLQLAIVPRKPERFDRVAGLISGHGFTCIRRSRRPDGQRADAAAKESTTVYLGDTMGELRKLYTLADIVVVGRSFVPMGGSDPMEAAARLGKCVIVGPHFDNFTAPVEAFRSEDAIRIVENPVRLETVIKELLAEPGTIEAVGDRARRVVISRRSATDATVRQLLSILAETKRP